ncbi:M48 family metalloprotease [Candidatus Woesearchaeota archaeon]|nr:M48 family metalloprotease [Candidatus Woesearchaeota archaeon]
MASLIAWKRYNKPWLLFAHLVFVLSPLFYIALSVNCSMKFVEGLLAWCTFVFAKAILYVLPFALSFALIGGVFILPRAYRFVGKPLDSALFNKLLRKTGIVAELFLINKGVPQAFTLGKRVFVSVGMFDVLSQKELEAVLLHELHHVKSGASWNKFSHGIVRAFSPIAWFSSSSVAREEMAADSFAARVQKTWKFVRCARNKVR